MQKTLTPRQEQVLKIIVQEYIVRGTPVASEMVTQRYPTPVSSATIRNDMVCLEREGYISRPHISAGAVPSCKGYRHYVESLVENMELPLFEQYFIQDFLKKVEAEFEELAKIASALLARLVRNAAVVTTPKIVPCRFKHLELVALQECLVLLILIMYQRKLKRQLLPTSSPVTEGELTIATNKLNAAYHNLTISEIKTKQPELSLFEKQVTEVVIDLMVKEEEMEYDEPYLEGLPLMLRQPEFAKVDRILEMVELMEEKEWLKSILPRELGEGEIKLVIGEENPNELLRDLSLVFTRYGVPGKVGGAMGVIGPTRMDYARTISSLSYLSKTLSQLVREAY